MTEKPDLEKILEVIIEITKSNIPFDLKYRKEIKEFNKLCDNFSKLFSESKEKESTASQAKNILANYNELQKYIETTGIGSQQIVIEQRTYIKNALDEKQKSDLMWIENQVGNENLDIVITRLYKQDIRKEKDKFEEGLYLFKVWHITNNPLLEQKLHELLNFCKSFDIHKARVEKIIEAYSTFINEIKDLKLNIDDQNHVDTIYKIAKDYAERIKFIEKDTEIILEKLNLSHEHDTSGWSAYQEAKNKGGTAGLFFSALINVHNNKAEEALIKTKFEFWQGIYHILSDEYDQFLNEMQQTVSKRYTLKIITKKGYFWDKIINEDLINFYQIKIKEKDGEIEVDPDFTRNYAAQTMANKVVRAYLEPSEMENIKKDYTTFKELDKKIQYLNKIIPEKESKEHLSKKYSKWGLPDTYNKIIETIEKNIINCEINMNTRVGNIAAKLQSNPDFMYHYKEYANNEQKYIEYLEST